LIPPNNFGNFFSVTMVHCEEICKATLILRLLTMALFVSSTMKQLICVISSHSFLFLYRMRVRHPNFLSYFY
jgi:hypothetical protein